VHYSLLALGWAVNDVTGAAEPPDLGTCGTVGASPQIGGNLNVCRNSDCSDRLSEMM
jgi:hypothetical protein